MARQARRGAEVLLEAVARVREPQRAVPRGDDVVRRVELAAVEARHDGLGRLAARHVVQAAGAVRQVALRAVEHAAAVGGRAGGHGHVRGRAQLHPLDRLDVAGVAAVQHDARDEDDGQRRAGGGLQQVGGDEELLVLWAVDACLVEKGVPRRLGGRQQQRMATSRVEARPGGGLI